MSFSGWPPSSSPGLVWAVIWGIGAIVPQQTLTDASRREAERRATVPRAERVLTNADLERDRPPPSVTVESAGASQEPRSVPAPAQPASGSVQDAARATAAAPLSNVTASAAPLRAFEEPQAPGLDVSGCGAETAAPGVRDEAWWRQRAEALSARKRRLGEQQRAMQNRVDMLTADIAGRDDPFQRAALEEDRRRALEELEVLGRDVADLDRTATAFEESARRQAVPAAWIRVEPG